MGQMNDLLGPSRHGSAVTLLCFCLMHSVPTFVAPPPHLQGFAVAMRCMVNSAYQPKRILSSCHLKGAWPDRHHSQTQLACKRGRCYEWEESVCRCSVCKSLSHNQLLLRSHAVVVMLCSGRDSSTLTLAQWLLRLHQLWFFLVTWQFGGSIDKVRMNILLKSCLLWQPILGFPGESGRNQHLGSKEVCQSSFDDNLLNHQFQKLCTYISILISWMMDSIFQTSDNVDVHDFGGFQMPQSGFKTFPNAGILNISRSM